MSTIPSSGVISNLMQSEQMLAALQNNENQLLKVQEQVSTGQKISSSSDDPVLAGQILDLNGVLDRMAQYKTNVTGATAMLSATDTALSNATDLLRQANSLALSSSSSTASSAELTANAQSLDSLIGQMQRLANQQFDGSYLFDGQAGQGDPFVTADGGTLYTGGSQPTRLAMDSGWTLAVPLDGGTVFGGQSQPVGSANNLDPKAVASTRLADLNGAVGMGVAPGAIRVSDGVNPPVVIDLSQAATVGDVINQFNAAAPAGTSLALAANGQQLVVHSSQPAASLTVTDLNGGTAARDLGLLAGGAGATVTGQNVGPRLTATTPIDELNGGAGLDPSGLLITNGSRSATLSFDPTGTVGDILNAINNAGVGVTASIWADGQSLQLVDNLSGTSLLVSENGGTTAAQLGLRTFNNRAPLSSFNNGRGVGVAGNGLADLHITQQDGTSFDVSLSGCVTVSDVLGAINGAAGNSGFLTASISPTDGIELTDRSVSNGTPLSVTALNGSTAAADLGLDQSTASSVLVGGDVSSAQTGGVFSDLAGLRQAIASNNQADITRYGGLVEQDVNNMVALRGQVGAQAAEVNAQGTQVDEQQTQTQTLLSQISGADLTQAATQFTQLQNQLQVSMETMGKMLSLNLLDFIK